MREERKGRVQSSSRRSFLSPSSTPLSPHTSPPTFLLTPYYSNGSHHLHHCLPGPVRAALRSMLDELEEILLARLAMDDATARLRLPPADAARLAATLTRGIVVMERIYHAPAALMATADSLVTVLFTAK